MATTMYYEGPARDKQTGELIDLEFGTSTYYGESLIYLNVDGKSVILNREDGQALYDAMESVGIYLSYDK